MKYENDLYLNSLCSEGLYLHDFNIVKTYDHGIMECCKRCKLRKYFSNKCSNRYYLSYHVKQSLQPYQKYFKRMYPNIK